MESDRNGRYHLQLAKIESIETKNLVIRGFAEKDLADVYEYASDEATVEFMTWPAYGSEDALRRVFAERFTGNPAIFCVELKAERRCIGSVELCIDEDNEKVRLEYVLNRGYWNKGYMTEALRKVITIIFSFLDANRVESTHYVGNEKAGRIMMKCGLSFEGIGRDELKIKGEFRDIVHYGLTKEDYRKGRGA